MRRIRSIAVLAACVFLITVNLTGINLLQTLQAPPEPMTRSQLSKGHVHLMFLADHFWQKYPDISPSRVFIHLPSMAFAGLLILMAYHFLGYRRKWPAIYVGLACFVAGFIPYSTGMWALSGNTNLSYCGKWIAVMLLGMLYCCIACAVFMILDIFKIDVRKIVPDVSLRWPYLRWKLAGSH